jgi:hypothetical protein
VPKAYRVAPAVSFSVDGKQFKLSYIGGKSSPKRIIGAEMSAMNWVLTSEILNAMKSMKSMSITIDNKLMELDAIHVAKARSFIADGMACNFDCFQMKAAGAQK